MFKGIKSCVGTLFSGVLLIGVAYAGWRWGGPIFPVVERWVGIERSLDENEMGIPTPEIAAAAEERFRRLAESGGPGEVELDALELNSLLRYGFGDRLPSTVARPLIEMEGARMRLAVTVSADLLPQLGELGGLLPDSVRLEAAGALIPFDGSGAAFVLDRLSAHSIPLPGRLVPAVLEALGREDAPGLPEDAVQVPLPTGLRSAYVRDGRLVLVGGG